MSITFPHFLQRNQMDCGPTCLYIISKHYGRNFSIEKLRELTEIGKEGVNILGISDAAEKIGFRTLAVQPTLQQLKEDIKLPCVLHWRQNHFVVLYKIKKNGFYISDPGKSLLKYTEREFVEGWVSAAAPPILPEGEGQVKELSEDLKFIESNTTSSSIRSSRFPPPHSGADMQQINSVEGYLCLSSKFSIEKLQENIFVVYYRSCIIAEKR